MKSGLPGKILIVDDDQRNRKLMVVQLESLGHEIHVAANGDEALDLIQDIDPDLVLLDVMMPGIDGYQVLEKIKGNRETMDLPVIMITALSDTQSRVKAYDLGADDFISKPPDRTEMMVRVRSLLKVKAYHDEMARYRDNLEHEVGRITEQLHLAYQNLKMASLDTIYRLTQASEYKDEDTGAHIQRVSRLSQAIARRLSLPQKVQDSLLYAAPMHDVGKIGIPDEILLKPGALNEDEWEVMKTHSLIGSQILSGSDSDILKMGEEIALTHHERWDGGGYPHHLAGEQIPITGRIVAVADVFDALTSRRPYRDPLPDEKATALVRDGADSQFDPRIVDAFLSLGDEVAEIREMVEDEDMTFHGETMDMAGALAAGSDEKGFH
jgi:putative two-component system response regulator